MTLDVATRAQCPLCDASDLVMRHALPHPDHKTARCASCRFTFMHPYPSDEFLDRHYRERSLYGFEGERAEHYSRAVADRRELIASLLAAIPNSRRRGRAVDFGAGPAMAVRALTFLKKYLVYPLLNIFAERTGLLGHGLVFIARKRELP